MKLSKRAGTELVLQNVQQIKTQITNSITGLTTTMQQAQKGMQDMQALMENVKQLDVQVRSLQQAQKVQQDATQKAQQATQPADDDAMDTAWWKKMVGKMWGKVEDTIGGDYKDNYTGNAVSGVRGQVEQDLFTILAKKKRKKKDKPSERPTPRDSEHTKELPDFWRKNLDYGESPYMHMDEIEKITDEVPSKKKKSEAQDQVPPQQQPQQPQQPPPPPPPPTQVQHMIFTGELEFMGSIRIDIRIVNIETGKVMEANKFMGKDINKARTDANAYIQQLQQKYPGTVVKQ
jgi:hypothetical protein